MALYTITCSTAYKADSINEPGIKLQKEPWLHVRLVSILKDRKVKWYWVVYVWDTREVVQWFEQPGHASSLRYTKAIDNGKPLKDPKHLLPGWAREKLCGRISPDKITSNGPYELTAKESSTI